MHVDLEVDRAAFFYIQQRHHLSCLECRPSPSSRSLPLLLLHNIFWIIRSEVVDDVFTLVAHRAQLIILRYMGAVLLDSLADSHK